MEAVESAEQGEQLLDKREFLMLITDAHLGGLNGYELLARARRRRPELPMLMITAYATPKLAAEAIKAGASDYLPKPFAPEELLLHVSRCAERYKLLKENAALRETVTSAYSLDSIIGDSPRLRVEFFKPPAFAKDDDAEGTLAFNLAGSTASNDGSSILEQAEAPIHISNVQVVDPSTKKPTRIGAKVETVTKNGVKKTVRVRVAKKSGKEI